MSIQSKSLVSSLLRRVSPRGGTPSRLLTVGGMLLGLASQSWSLNKVLSVSAVAGRGDFTSIQAAINSCDPVQDVCQINILDAKTVLMAPLWIEGKANITLQSGVAGGAKTSLQFDPSLYALVANPNPGQQAQVAKIFTLSWQDISGTSDPTRPTGWLMWPMKGSSTCPNPTVGPMGLCSDTTSRYSSSGFQHNGMIVIKKSRDITIKGIKLSSRYLVFQNKGIWSGMYDIISGTVGINIFQSLRVNADGNELSGFFSAFYINGRNVGGMFGTANPDDWDVKFIVPLSRYGQVGDHSIQRNYLHDNWWGFYFESSWDKSSRIHHNVSYNNMNKGFQYLDSVKVPDATTSEMNNQTGGFVYMKDAVLATDRIYNNTILRSPIVLGFGGWRAGSQELFYNNVVRGTTEADALAGKKMMADWHQHLSTYGVTTWANTFQMDPGVALTYTVPKNVQITDATITGVNGAGSTCSGGCWMTVSPTSTLSYVSQMQPQFLWNGWQAGQGVDYVVKATDLVWSATAAGYAGKSWTVHDNNGYNPWGLVSTLAPATLPAALVKSRNNLFAMQLPTALDSIRPDPSFGQASPINLLQLAPLWSNPAVDATIRNKAWYNDNFGNPDGTPSDRGAFCYDSITGKTSLGCQRSGPVLSLVDQQIVGVRGTTANIPIILQQVDGLTGATASGFTGFKIDSVYYYDAFPFSTLPAAGTTPGDESQKPYVTPLKISSVTWAGTSGAMASFALPNAVTKDYARFDVFLTALDPISGKRVSVIGVYFYRKLQYQMVVKFCATAACPSSDSITSARVGDPIYMQSYITDALGVKLPTQQVSRVYVTPGAGVNLRNMTTPPGKLVDTSEFLSGFTGNFVSPVEFETRGNLSVTVTGVVGSSSSAIGVMGTGSITIRPGKPYQVQFVTPQTYQVKKCNGNPSDTTNGCNDLQGVVPNLGTLVVTDKYGNTVDIAANVTVGIAATAFSGPIASASAVPGSVTKTGASQTAVLAGSATATVTTDSVGNASFWVVGDPGTAGALLYKANTFPWVQLTGVVQGVAGAPTDTAVARLMPPAGHLAWRSPAVVDTFILTARPVVLWLTKDNLTADVGNPNAGSYVSVRAASSYIKFYADSTMRTSIHPDSIKLVAGQARFWVASSKPTSGFDSLVGEILGASTSGGLPVRFTNPPQPPTPVMKSALFLDKDCDGLADAVSILFDPAGAVSVLDTAKVKINRIRFALASGDSVVLDGTSVRPVVGGASVTIALPVGAQAKFPAYTPSAPVQVWAALVRPPAADTVVLMGKVNVTDGIGPRPVGATLVENATPATVADTLTVYFSEPVQYTGSAWPLRTFTAGMTEVPSPEIVVMPGSEKGPGTSLRFILTGNTKGHLVEKTILAIAAGAGLTDLAGNDSRYAACGKDTTLVALKTNDVQVKSSQIFDTNGDGQADLVKVTFRREFRKSAEKPDSLVVVDWIGATSRTLLMAGADSVGLGVYSFKLTPAFPLGSTYGTAAGNGTLVLQKGTGPSARFESGTLDDSVAPIAVGVAKIEFGVGSDKLVVTYSEPMVSARPGAEATMVLKSASGDLALSFANAAPNGDKTSWTFDVPAGKLQVGDLIRLPAGVRSQLGAASGQLPSGLGAAPYVPVVGGDRAPDSGLVLDRDGDGIADAVRLFYTKAPVGNPSFSFTWAGKTVVVDSAAYANSVAGKLDVTLDVSGFTFATSGTGSALSTSYAGGTAVSPLAFALKDGIAPVLVSAYVTYGLDDGAADTLRLKLSEPAAWLGADSKALVKSTSKGVEALIAAGSKLAGAGADEFLLVCQAPGCQLPGFGDSASLAAGAASDANGAVVGSVSRKVPVTTGPKPIRYNVKIFPNSLMALDSTPNNPLRKLPSLSAWVRADGASDSSWTAEGSTAALWTGSAGKVSMDDIHTGLVGLKLDLNTSFDGQFLAYDNLGTFVGKVDVKVTLEDLQARGLLSGANKYSLLVGLNGVNQSGKPLAFGVFMMRVVSYSEQVVNGQSVRVMVQNRVYKMGMRAVKK